MPAAAERKSNSIGLIFDLPEGSFYSDGVFAGAGVKFFIDNSYALRVMNFFDYSYGYYSADPTITFFLSGSLIKHFIFGISSPYFGALLGFYRSDNDVLGVVVIDNSVALGPLFGVEVKLTENISLFGEYRLLMFSGENQGVKTFFFSNYIPINKAKNSTMGLILYF
jgi:hypothetical protein